MCVRDVERPASRTPADALPDKEVDMVGAAGQPHPADCRRAGKVVAVCIPGAPAPYDRVIDADVDVDRSVLSPVAAHNATRSGLSEDHPGYELAGGSRELLRCENGPTGRRLPRAYIE